MYVYNVHESEPYNKKYNYLASRLWMSDYQNVTYIILHNKCTKQQ